MFVPVTEPPDSSPKAQPHDAVPTLSSSELLVSPDQPTFVPVTELPETSPTTQPHDTVPIVSPNLPPLNTTPTKVSSSSHDSQKITQKESVQQTRHGLGLNPTAPIIEKHDSADHQDLLWSRIRVTLREPFAEFWGVVIMVLFGDGAVAQVLLSAGLKTAPGGNGYGEYQSISWG